MAAAAAGQQQGSGTRRTWVGRQPLRGAAHKNAVSAQTCLKCSQTQGAGDVAAAAEAAASWLWGAYRRASCMCVMQPHCTGATAETSARKLEGGGKTGGWVLGSSTVTVMCEKVRSSPSVGCCVLPSCPEYFCRCPSWSPGYSSCCCCMGLLLLAPRALSTRRSSSAPWPCCPPAACARGRRAAAAPGPCPEGRCPCCW